MNTLWKIDGRRIDGRPVTVLMRDLGDLRPAYDARALAYEAYQTEWHIDGKVYFTVLDKCIVERTQGANQASRLRLEKDDAFLESMGIDASSLDFEGKTMALMGPDGETHSHLRPAQGEQSQRVIIPDDDPRARRVELPDRGTWVGPRGGRHHDAGGLKRFDRPGEWADEVAQQNNPDLRGLPLDPPQSTLPARGAKTCAPSDAALEAIGSIRHLLEHQPMVGPQRRALMQALVVLESFR